MSKSHIDIIAHRVNSIAIFEKYMQAGVSGIEFDVQVTKDGVPVLYHDSVTEDGKKISDMMLEDVRKLKSPDDQDSLVPTLEEALEYAGESGLPDSFTFFMELKGDAEGLAEKALQVFEQRGQANHNLVVISFFAKNIREIEELKAQGKYAEVRTGINIWNKAADIPKGEDECKETEVFGGEVIANNLSECVGVLTTAGVNPDVISLDCRLLGTEGGVDSIRKARDGVKIITWTVNDSEIAKRVSKDVEAIITDTPMVIKAALGRGNGLCV